MHALERIAKWCKGLLPPSAVDRVRGAYEGALDAVTFGRGLPRRVNGCPLRVSPHHRYLAAEGAYEPEVWELFRRELRPDDVVFDVGAHFGLYAILLARLGARVHAFEPAPVTLDLLRYHLRINSATSRVEVVPTAVGSEPGTAWMQTSGPNVVNTLSREGAGLARSEPRPVAVTTLDRYSQERSLLPRWVKIDTEGWELRVLEGAVGLIREVDPPTFVVEVHPWGWSGAGHGRRELESFLDQHGLELTPLSDQVDPLAEYGHVRLVRSGS